MTPEQPPSDTGQRILAYYAAHPAPSVREIVSGCGLSSTSVATYWLRRLAKRGALVETSGRATARRYRLPGSQERPAVTPARDMQNLTSVVRLLLERTERRGGYGVVPWAAIEALREAVQVE